MELKVIDVMHGANVLYLYGCVCITGRVQLAYTLISIVYNRSTQWALSRVVHVIVGSIITSGILRLIMRLNAAIKSTNSVVVIEYHTNNEI